MRFWDKQLDGMVIDKGEKVSHGLEFRRAEVHHDSLVLLLLLLLLRLRRCLCLRHVTSASGVRGREGQDGSMQRNVLAKWTKQREGGGVGFTGAGAEGRQPKVEAR